MLVEQDESRVDGDGYEVEETLTHLYRLIPVFDSFPAFALSSGNVISVPALGICPVLIAVPPHYVSKIGAIILISRCGYCCGRRCRHSVGVCLAFLSSTVTQHLFAYGVPGLPVLLEGVDGAANIFTTILYVAIVIQVYAIGRDQSELSFRAKNHIFRSGNA